MTELRGRTVFLCFLVSLTLFSLANSSRSGKFSQKSVGVEDGIRRLCTEEVRSWSDLFSPDRLDAWICSVIGSLLVAMSGVFPLLVIPIKAGAALKSEEGSQRLKLLLSFAIGGLLGDVFLHLLPEAWAYSCSAATGGTQSSQQQKLLGLWVVIGIVTFLVLEKAFTKNNVELVKERKPTPSTQSKNGGPVLNGCHFVKKSSVIKSRKSASSRNQLGNGASRDSAVPAQPTQSIKISGYLNLLANCIDNFTHGLAVAGSFLVSKKVGCLTTMAILLHEIPHEVGDFAILLRAGFDRWSAAKMQIATALGGVLGACFAMCSQSPKGAGDTVAWILPFTSGGFIYIALVNVVPDLLQERSLWNSVRQTLLLCTGIAVMYLLSVIVE
ncbi:zinc transporter ZIP13 isoform X1 [Protopterus annectens]|uniref:zinc transporter ZIP13 isoform X1 n=1 Tax=Protopterus annectens TaxID=7888 RepID=UPI001CFBC271|nr:zinc transporter ZIP13 isoform X1 [Protopterus annectens]